MNTSSKSVSVVMLTYNHEEYIKEAIESVLMQKCDFEVELIIADDCSPDQTQEIVKSIIENHPNGSWIKYTRHIENKGPIPNSMWILDQAKGKYIALCEGDDHWTDPLKLQRQIDLIEARNAAGSYTDTDELQRDGIIIPWRKDLPKLMTLDDVISTKSPFHTSTFVFKKELFKELPPWFKSIGSADMFLFAYISRSGVLVKAPCKPTVYRKHEGGITNTNSNKSFNLQLARIFLWTNFKREYSVSSAKIDAVISDHISELIRTSKIDQYTFFQNSNFDIVKLLGRKMLSKQILSSLFNRK